jgi:acetolactate synthase-1/3 small subunit
MAKHTLIAYVEDVPGVLNRVASLFRRRNFNIDSLTVGGTDQPGVSRLTVVVEATEAGARIVEANLYKLVNVLRVDDLTHKASLTRELGLVKVKVTPDTRAQVLQLVEVFRARVVDVDEKTLTVEVTGTPEKIVKFEMVMRPYGIAEMVRTGAVSMARGHEPVSTVPTSARSGPADHHHDNSGISMSV